MASNTSYKGLQLPPDSVCFLGLLFVGPGHVERPVYRPCPSIQILSSPFFLCNFSNIQEKWKKSKTSIHITISGIEQLIFCYISFVLVRVCVCLCVLTEIFAT